MRPTPKITSQLPLAFSQTQGGRFRDEKVSRFACLFTTNHRSALLKSTGMAVTLCTFQEDFESWQACAHLSGGVFATCEDIAARAALARSIATSGRANRGVGAANAPLGAQMENVCVVGKTRLYSA